MRVSLEMGVVVGKEGNDGNENKNNDVGFPFRSSCVSIMEQSGRTANDAGNTMATKCHIITISLICHRNLHMITLDPFPARGSLWPAIGILMESQCCSLLIVASGGSTVK